MIPVKRSPEDMGGYMDKSAIEAAYRHLSEEMRGLRLRDEDMHTCIDDYGKLGAAVTNSLMRRDISNYEEAVGEGAVSSEDSKNYFKRFRAVMPFHIYSTVWALDQAEMKDGSDRDARKRAENHFKTLNDPDNIIRNYFPEKGSD